MKWLILPLEQIAEISGGSTPSRIKSEFWNGDIAWVTPTDLPMPGQGIAEINATTDYITELGLSSCSANLLPVGTVIFSSRATIGKIGISQIPLATNQGFTNFIPKPFIYNRFLAYSLQYYTPEIIKLAGSTTFKEVSKSSIKKFKIPFPPPSEQRRIVEILDQADALRKMRAEADAKAERILPALFIKMFGEPSTWTDANTQPLGSLVNIQSGGTPSKKNPDYWDGDIPWVSPKDMKQDIIFDSIEHISQKAIAETNIKYVEPGAILIVVRGMILAHTIPIALAATRLTINQDMKAIYPNSNDIDSTYLHAALKASSRKILSQVGTAAHGTRKFDTDELLKLPILIPSEEKLKKFQQAVTDCRASLAGISKTKEKLEKLFEILLRRAFSGELTAKWREAHMKELLAEMEEQVKALNLRDNADPQQLSLL
ncbi:MAG: restriction endonuclease subunit S [Fischerella sp. CENA71]|nr:restriction endonuclease subunit S [Fischerella sp. CENA71]